MSADVNGFACPHLQPFLDHLRADGATTVRLELGWSNVRANLVLSAGPTLAAARARWTLPQGVELWSNDDPHSSVENGLVSRHCQGALSWAWPERRGEISS